MDQIKELCCDFSNVRGELRLSVKNTNVAALCEALSKAGYVITIFCESFTPGVFDVRAV